MYYVGHLHIVDGSHAIYVIMYQADEWYMFLIYWCLKCACHNSVSPLLKVKTQFWLDWLSGLFHMDSAGHSHQIMVILYVCFRITSSRITIYSSSPI